ncbi:MAG: glycosyltransferase [Nitrospiraceae bacterium]|nr:glycosyltransferase [Nitrospiraceae bacterium]MDA8091057.1 glycosyltransferase [Nitrospiraceae bacterium]
MAGILWVFSILAAAGLVCYGLQFWSILAAGGNAEKQKERSGDIQEETAFLPPVSILKPLKGLDDNLFDNLESFCLLDYPCYELIFALQDRNDQAYKVAVKVRNKYPDKDIKIVVQRRNEGLNPKVNNLLSAYEAARHEYVLISDSNVFAGKDYLKMTVAPMRDTSVGLVSNLVEGVGGRTAGSILENLHLNSFVMGSVCFLDRFLDMPCVVGKSMLMRKKDLEAVGGLRGVKDVLAEDYLLGRKMHDSGRKVVLSPYRIQNVNHYWSLKRFLNRHTRWGKLRWKIGGAKYLSELAANAVFISAIPLLILGPSGGALALALSTSLIKTAGDLYIGRKTGTGLSPLSYLLVPVKDILIGIVWFVPVFSSRVVWRGNRYRIGKDSMLSPYPHAGAQKNTWGVFRLVNTIRERFA